MPRYFKLAAIIVQEGQIKLYRIPLRQELQQNLANNWNEQEYDFRKNMKEEDFTLGYSLEGKELFRLYSEELSNWIETQAKSNMTKLDSDNEKELIDYIEGIVAFTRDDKNDDIILFQNFTPSQIIRSNRLMFIRGDQYEELDKPAISLSTRLSAVYIPDDRKLLFRSFRNIKTFLPLSDFYDEASEEDILEVLNHRLFECQDKKTLVDNSTQWIRKRFAMLKETKILDRLSITQIGARSENFDINIKVKDDKIVFPTDNVEAKKLLQLLNEEIFRGALTDDLYETNSKKKADR